MDTKELLVHLKDNKINPCAYSIGIMTDPGEEYTLLHGPNGWEVFYNERGNKNCLKVFATEEEACVVFLENILNDPTTRIKKNE